MRVLCAFFLLYAPLAFTAPTSPLKQEQTSTDTLLPSQESSPEKTASPLPSTAEEMTHSYQSAFVRMLLSLLALLGLLFGTFWVLKRLGKGKFRIGSHKQIQILEKRPLSQKTVLYLVEIEGKQVLLSESQLEVRALTTLEAPTPMED